MKKGRGINMAKNYKEIFKIEPSTTTPNAYIVFRKNDLNFQEVAYVKVKPGLSYRLEALIALNYEEVQYLQKQFKKMAGLKNKETQVFII